MKAHYIYMLLPANTCGGGPELGHQLVHYLRQNGINAYVVYINQFEIICNTTTPIPYAHYNAPSQIEIEDNINNWLIIPETLFHIAKRFKNIQIGCWWMSVDNFTARYTNHASLKISKNNTSYENYRALLCFLLGRMPISKYNLLYYFRTIQNRTIHLTQSEYARQYLLRHNMKNIYPLSDYINPELFPNYPIDLHKKEDIVLYNPAKGYEFTQQIIQRMPDVQFIPLKGLNREELNRLFDRAKVYIDFGHFPGKDRLPREAALHHCCIITGTEGASRYEEDVPIPQNFKISRKFNHLPLIETKIREIFTKYTQFDKLFDKYRDIISSEKKSFEQEVKDIFC